MARPVERHVAEWEKLPADARAAWIRLLRVHREVTARIDGALAKEHAITLVEWDGLVRIAGAGAEGVRMTELANVVLLTASGLTRLVERLERRGLVERRRGEKDARETYARVTPRGLDLLAQAARAHNRELQAHFLDALTEGDVERLARILGKVLDADAKCAFHG